MRCYQHHQAEALAICKNCNKGLCNDCAVDVGHGIACKSSCEQAVKDLNDIQARSKGIYQKTSSTYTRLAFIYALLGSFFIVFSYLSDISMGGFLIPIGIIFLLGAIFVAYSAKKFDCNRS